jgi:cell wall-associated NlpC family hydrolase
MASSGGISGVAVAVGTVGTLLVYAGMKGTNPVQALKDISSGKPAGVSKTGTSSGDGMILGEVPTNTAGGAVSPTPITSSALVEAALSFRSDKYSQAKRWQSGYSDCSSFVGKALKKLGITPPGSSVTGSYLSWNALTNIPKSQIQAGDFLCGSAHIAIAVSADEAIGQQNTRRNVQIDSIKNIMFGQSWVARRFKNPDLVKTGGTIQA